MFLSSGIRVTKEEVDAFFEVCKPGAKGSLSFNEFKTLQQNPAADELFRFYIMRSQKENEQNYGKGINNIYMPCNLSRLLEHMTVKQRRETVLQRIDQDRLNPDKVEDTIKNYIKLFIISRGALDSISNDRWSRKVQLELIKHGHKERIAIGEKVTLDEQIQDLYDKATKTESKEHPTCLKRLDSLHLEELAT